MFLVTLARQVADADAQRVKFLAEKLRADDFRVRTDAALALGATNEDDAVDAALRRARRRDEVVRQASAVALKRLGRSALGVPQGPREPIEQNEAAKIAITRAIEAMSAARDGRRRRRRIKDNPNAKYYISLSTIANQTGRPRRRSRASCEVDPREARRRRDRPARSADETPDKARDGR